jgi:hypothetical protein
MLWLSWFRMAQASIFSAVPCTVFMCHLCETIMCWTTECSSPGHEKTTKPSKIRLVSEYVKKTWYKACSTTVCQVCDTSDRKQGRGFLTMRQGQVASRWRISPRPEHRDNMGGLNIGGPQVTMVVSLLNGLMTWIWDTSSCSLPLLNTSFQRFDPAVRPHFNQSSADASFGRRGRWNIDAQSKNLDCLVETWF